jgi:succinate dehydrogenase/fumarate reductase-like Fe-S protein
MGGAVSANLDARVGRIIGDYTCLQLFVLFILDSATFGFNCQLGICGCPSVTVGDTPVPATSSTPTNVPTPLPTDRTMPLSVFVSYTTRKPTPKRMTTDKSIKMKAKKEKKKSMKKITETNERNKHKTNRGEDK